MQYILSQEELDALKARQALQIEAATRELQAVCTVAARHIPIVIESWPSYGERPWGCILDGDGNHNMGYCDHCPVRKICPHEDKRWSK